MPQLLFLFGERVPSRGRQTRRRTVGHVTIRWTVVILVVAVVRVVAVVVRGPVEGVVTVVVVAFVMRRTVVLLLLLLLRIPLGVVGVAVVLHVAVNVGPVSR